MSMVLRSSSVARIAVQPFDRRMSSCIPFPAAPLLSSIDVRAMPGLGALAGERRQTWMAARMPRRGRLCRPGGATPSDVLFDSFSAFLD